MSVRAPRRGNPRGCPPRNCPFFTLFRKIGGCEYGISLFVASSLSGRFEFFITSVETYTCAVQIQRISPNQVLVNGPLKQVREAAWYALWNEFLTTPKQFGRYRDEYEPEPMIAGERNIVSATRGNEL